MIYCVLLEVQAITRLWPSLNTIESNSLLFMKATKLACCFLNVDWWRLNHQVERTSVLSATWWCAAQTRMHLGSDGNVGARLPNLVGFFAIPPPTEHVLAWGKAGWDQNIVHNLKVGLSI
jgi:hypothetical protein